MNASPIPPIERWWPHIDIEFKHEILRDPDAALSQGALDQMVGFADGVAPVGPVYLTASDKDYIRTQTELVD
ncbi:MAG: hypothetical protein ABIX44_01645 [Cryobacterium sp.]